ncbi:MAG TPA: dephospho-CoA kinase [Candidatus Binataceae bacterium]|nr:dephospho-CoA kinase [Candidatus Binataceae bacterium]
MMTIGLTGGIGSGKSTATQMLAELGATVLDADKVAHSTYALGGPAYGHVVAAFGREILAQDNTIDRKKLGAIVFGKPDELRRLTDIVWPATYDALRAEIAAMRARGEKRPIVIEAAILIEAGWKPLFDEIWLVRAPRAAVIERIERQRGLKPAETEARIRAQLSDDERAIHATLVIDNHGSIDDLRGTLARIWKDALAQSG